MSARYLFEPRSTDERAAELGSGRAEVGGPKKEARSIASTRRPLSARSHASIAYFVNSTPFHIRTLQRRRINSRTSSECECTTFQLSITWILVPDQAPA